MFHVIPDERKHTNFQAIDGTTVPLNQADIKALSLDATPATTAVDATDADLDSTAIVDNITVGQARIIMTGDIGIEAWQKKATRK
jgi:hypothetical protein